MSLPRAPLKALSSKCVSSKSSSQSSLIQMCLFEELLSKLSHSKMSLPSSQIYLFLSSSQIRCIFRSSFKMSLLKLALPSSSKIALPKELFKDVFSKDLPQLALLELFPNQMYLLELFQDVSSKVSSSGALPRCLFQRSSSKMSLTKLFPSYLFSSSSKDNSSQVRSVGVDSSQVLASKTKIYMVLEYVTGGELFDRIESKGRLREPEGRKLFQQLIDAVSYCHEKGVFHRDLKPENVLLDTQGNIKISDFGLSALPQQFGHDGLLHTTCGSPNYVAPEVIANKGYDGAMADIWSCGVILYVILTGCLPFDDRNLAVLYQKISKGDVQIPKWLSAGARNMIRRILDPNPQTRINMAKIKEDLWFKQNYTPVEPEEDEEDTDSDVESFSIREVPEADKHGDACHHINAFELIGMSSCLDLSGFFEEEDASSRKIRFTSNCQPEELLKKIEDIVTSMGLQVQRGHGKLKVMQNCEIKTSVKSLSAVTEVFELGPSLYVVELRKTHGDSSMYRQLWAKLSDSLGVSKSQEALTNQPLMSEHKGFKGESAVAA